MDRQGDVGINDKRQRIGCRQEAAGPTVEFKKRIGRAGENDGRVADHIARGRHLTASRTVDRESEDISRREGVAE